MARKRQKVWQLSRRAPGPATPDAQEKAAVVDACETFIDLHELDVDCEEGERWLAALV